MTGRRRRWYGDPVSVEQPDVGDVLVYQDLVRHREWYHLVLFATQVRGRGPHDLWLVVERHDLIDGVGIPDPIFEAHQAGARFYSAEIRRSGRRRAAR